MDFTVENQMVKMIEIVLKYIIIGLPSVNIKTAWDDLGETFKWHHDLDCSKSKNNHNRDAFGPDFNCECVK